MLTDYQIIANCAKLGYLGQLEAESHISLASCVPVLYYDNGSRYLVISLSLARFNCAPLVFYESIIYNFRLILIDSFAVCCKRVFNEEII